MVQEEDVLGDADHVGEVGDGGVIEQVRVDDGRDKPGYVWPHAVLSGEGDALYAVVYQPLEERDVQMVLLGQLVHLDFGAKLLVVTCNKEVYGSFRQKCLIAVLSNRGL